jgi:hypothetical protein
VHAVRRQCNKSHIYNQKSEDIDFKGLAEVIDKLIFNNQQNILIQSLTLYRLFSAIYGPIFNESLS